MTYDGREFYGYRERHSATSSEKGMALFNDRRRVDQIDTESDLSVHTFEVSHAIILSQLMENEFFINLFA